MIKNMHMNMKVSMLLITRMPMTEKHLVKDRNFTIVYHVSSALAFRYRCQSGTARHGLAC
jgi:hypothetical protein